MKKLIAMGMALAVGMTSLTVPVKADNSEEVIIGVLGGVLGGLIIGGAIANERHDYDPYYYEGGVERRVERRVYRRNQSCRVYYYEEYVPGYGYQVLRRYKCW